MLSLRGRYAVLIMLLLRPGILLPLLLLWWRFLLVLQLLLLLPGRLRSLRSPGRQLHRNRCVEQRAHHRESDAKVKAL